MHFSNSGETLAACWGDIDIDGYPVTAEYRGPGEELPEPSRVDAGWYAEHVRESQYFLQVSFFFSFFFL